MLRVFTLQVILGLFLTALCCGRAVAQSTDHSENTAALQDLQKFLFDPAARASFSQGKSDATAANNFLEAFPKWAQNELLEIVMMIAAESMLGASKHVTAYQQGGVQGAKESFSPAVKARVDGLIQKLQSDPKFNNPGNLQHMNRLLPALKSNSM
jgi:hypothetical protein